MEQWEEDAPADQLDEKVYEELYQHSKRDFRRSQARGFFKTSFRLLMAILAITGVSATLVYVTLIRSHLRDLDREIGRYTDEVVRLNSEIQKLAAAEHFYRTQIDEYHNAFNNLIIEDSRLIDIDLTEVVRRSLEGFEDGGFEYYNITRGNTAYHETALTFDLGTGEDLPAAYAALNRLGARATIFIGNEMSSLEYGSLFKERNLHYLAKMGELGCEFGNHTWSHYHLKRSIYETSRKRRLHLAFVSEEVLDEFALIMEFDRVRRRFKEQTGLDLSPIWRAPYGAIDHRILSVAAKAGFSNHIFWSANEAGPLDFFDYERRRTIRIYDNEKNRFTLVGNPNYYTSGEMLLRMKEWEKVDEHGLRGAIAIAHLGTARKIDKMVKILPEYISYFQNRGYHFVTVSQLMNDQPDY
jgi:peptidoglycan/xylan/chitin deacetylase (PgdA/CDA1 family)